MTRERAMRRWWWAFAFGVIGGALLILDASSLSVSAVAMFCEGVAVGICACIAADVVRDVLGG